ncbi:Gfo/Idh/MocA family protein [Allorhodopirellula heiligendammensis]|uniref:Inositol 2-dehydrogenase/D-chiro-inositol 3-dehydrogenase n=1 Tax=Allorhodopirellula heiligendammensis TaxID=2714739 RepID=A0A5C6BJE0_9BACT|nr:Gfo/Idh/MocA family oxidoreductase [Allorhodopirellula heiligendammensis]TWU10564.1 Inositol 2-dehydrogenase/D-chiro-inositol 3-dehydrogenase [Allorhodopirellula heiligendammensis]
MDRRNFAMLASGLTATALTAQGQPAARPFEVAIIGSTGRGDYGHGLDTVWQRIPRTEIVSVADVNDEGRTREIAKLKLPEAAGYRDYREMLAKVQPDIVAVCPRYLDQHSDMILSAIEFGAKGIYVEKPFVRAPAEADQVRAASQAQNVRIAVAHRNRYHPTLNVIGGLLRDGRIGKLLEIRGRGKGDRRGGCEDLWVLGSHVLNMITALAGPPRTCSAVLLQDGRPATSEDIFQGAEGLGPLAGNQLHARFLLASGVVAFFDSVANDGTQNQGFGLQLIGSEGTIAIQADRNPLAFLRPGNPFATIDKSAGWLPITSAGVNVPEPDPAAIRRVQHHDAAAEDLIDAIENNREPLCDAADASLTIEMICAVFESHRQGGMNVAFPLVQRDHPLRQG